MYLSEVYGKGGIYAKCVTASIANNIPIYTLETKAPFNIDAECEKHRIITRNSSSGRAIPISTTTQYVLDNTYLPFDVRLNERGMQGYNTLNDHDLELFHNDLLALRDDIFALVSKWRNVHKQHLNDFLKPFMFQKKVWTGTEWDNFFKLRLAPDAKPEIQELARCMKEAMEQVEPIEFGLSAWHLPYINFKKEGEMHIENLKKCSVARCARVSYMNHDNTEPDIEKDLELYDTLLESKHMTPFEHQATPMNFISIHGADNPWENGVTHTDRNGRFWSGNFRGWIQNRQLLEDWNE